MDRRVFLQTSASAAAVHLLPVRTSLSREMPRTGAAEGMLVIADERYGESLAFARALQRENAVVSSLQRGLARLWFDDLLPRLRGRATVAGLTLESDLFAVQRLAEELGVQARYIGLHDWRSKAGSIHVLSGHVDLSVIAGTLSRCGDLWAVGLARALTSDKLAFADRQERRLRVEIGRAKDNPGFLASWVLA